jgi:hypothetical protein
MRKFVLFVAVAIVGAALFSGVACATEPQDAKAAQATKDPNFRWHNGQWWYWMGKDKQWLVWNGSQWNKFDPSQASSGGARRSFSYDPAASASYGGTYAGFGNVTQNGPIIGSYGFRSAASKADGNY